MQLGLYDLEASKYPYLTRMQHNIEVLPDQTTWVTFEMVYSILPGCLYRMGDLNSSGGFTGLDVVYGVTYLKGGPPPAFSCECRPGHTWYVQGDVNGSCSFTGLDITYMVAFLKGEHDYLIPCCFCPPPLER